MAEGGEAYYRSTADALLRDNALLRERVEKLEKANRQLMRSVFDLSAALSAASIPPPPLHILPEEDTLPDDRPSKPKLSVSDSSMASPEPPRSPTATPSTPGEHATPPAKLNFVERHEWTGHKGAVYALRFSPSGRTLAAAGFDRSVRLWDVLKGEPATTLSEAHAGPVSDVGWSADGYVLLLALSLSISLSLSFSPLPAPPPPSLLIHWPSTPATRSSRAAWTRG